MFVSTFYSFKGGVGRTQALVNVGAELAQRGKRVLLVDFDLEAPGVHTFFQPHRRTSQGGVVEYVTDYLRSGEAQDVREYVTEVVTDASTTGTLLMMPAGHHDAGYSNRLAQIDWPTLYGVHSGYLLFEDLKLQWERSLDVDYVLIDSRTGHTDVGGICTRQLPDCVTILFMPNDQNLYGLPTVVSDIREEGRSSRKKRIEMLFVMSNVPDLDDEENILQRRREAFSAGLGYRDLAATIHRYDSLSLLDQVVFTLRRPSTRLAREFRLLTERIMRLNVLDSDGARAFIDSVMRGDAAVDVDDVDARLERIRLAHAADIDVLQRLAVLRFGEARFEDALPLLSQIIDSGAASPAVLLRRAEALLVTGRTKEASSDIERMFRSPDATEREITRAIRLLRQADRDGITNIADSQALGALSIDARLRIAASLALEVDSQQVAAAILRTIKSDSRRTLEQEASAREELGMALIGIGVFADAVEELSGTDASLIRNTFNLGMADWGFRGDPQARFFEKVIELQAGLIVRGDANFDQCLAVAYAVCGRSADAVGRVHAARQTLSEQPLHQFSCWRYARVAPVEFGEDLDEIMRLASGERVVPQFIRRHVMSTVPYEGRDPASVP